MVLDVTEVTLVPKNSLLYNIASPDTVGSWKRRFRISQKITIFSKPHKKDYFVSLCQLQTYSL
jgi:hypothetical protein